MVSHRRRKEILFITIALCVISVILAFGHFILYEFLIIAFAVNDPYTLLMFKIVLGVLAASFVLASIPTRWYNSVFTRVFYTISAVWLGFSLYFFGISLLYILYACFGPLSPTLGALFIAVAFFTGLYGVINANVLRVTRISAEILGLPSQWKGSKAVFMSDIHLGQVRGERFSKKIVRAVKKLSPDIVFIGGDAYDGVKVDAEAVIRPFSELHPSRGIYFVPGNHEEFSDGAEYFEALKKAGIRVLVDEAVVIDGVRIVGVDYKTTEDILSYEKVLGALVGDRVKDGGGSGMPSILLKHVPSHVDVAVQKGIPLQLSGHTHRAQVFPFAFITRLVYEGFDYGLKRKGPTQVYTSSGVGTWGPPLRVGTRSEIVLIEFK